MKHHIATRSGFSMGTSLLSPKQIVKLAKSQGFESVALADVMNISGMVEFSNAAKSEGIRGIVGATIRIAENPTEKEARKGAAKSNPKYTLKVFAKSEKGVKSLFKLISIGFQEDYFHYVPRVGLKEVLDTLEQCIVTTGDFEGVGSYHDCDAVMEKLHRRFGDDFLVELPVVDTLYFERVNIRLMQQGLNLGCNFTVSHPSLYEKPTDADTLTVLQGIATNTEIDNIFLPRLHTKTFELFDVEGLETRKKIHFAKMLKAGLISRSDVATVLTGLTRSEAKWTECNYVFEKMPVSLPKMGDDALDEFRKVAKRCQEGWIERLLKPTLGYMPPASMHPTYIARLKYELGVLQKMGFSSYFLLTQEIVSWARGNGVRTGPGRGSVGGSLVAYLMGITDVDPIRFGLIFERFINPERIDLPDADLDFMSSRRHMVIDELVRRYGADRVGGISNYGTLASASALRDTGRIFGLDNFALSPTKLVPKVHGTPLPLTEAAEQVPELEKFSETYPTIWGHATALEGAMRSFSQHAAGVVVAGEDLINRAVVESRSGTRVVNWDKRIVEDLGLVKMDILGLSTLDVLEIAKEMILQNHGQKVEYLELPLDDEKILEAFGRGETQGVFQFESGGMRKLLKDLREGGKLTFNDISAATALYRPGPMDSGMMADYVDTRRGRRDISYEHPAMAEALDETYGVAVYQEQVMKLARDIAGFTLPEADALRKAMGKKDAEKMAKMRDKWVNGCITHVGLEKHVAEYLFEKIEKFAAYGFNKSHSVAYSIISWWTMYLKVYFPAEYFAASLSIVGEDKIQGLVKDAQSSGIEVLPPQINYSGSRYAIKSAEEIVAPFNVVKGISEATAERIVELRKSVGGRFTSIEHFESVCSAKGSKVNVRVRENLGKVGALAEFEAIPARHPSRLKVQMELMGSIVVTVVKSDRISDVSDKFVKAKIIHVVKAYNECSACDLHCNAHPTVRLGKKTRFMVVTDCPTWEEEKAGKMFEGESAKFLRHAMEEAKLNPAEGYYTSVVKAKKTEKTLTNEQLNNCKHFLQSEIEIVKPGCIVALGANAIKFFAPDFKGSTADAVGKSIFLPELDCTVVFGINPQQAIFDTSKIDTLIKSFSLVAEVVN